MKKTMVVDPRSKGESGCVLVPVAQLMVEREM
jgi:hypothetical protein